MTHIPPSDRDPEQRVHSASDNDLERNLERNLDRNIDRLLAIAPQYHVPPDFAERVAASAGHLPSGVPHSASGVTHSRPTSVGLWLTAVSLVLLLLALITIASHAAVLSRATLLTTNLVLSAELLFTVIGLSWWRWSTP